jgi:diadenylate cyclase
MTVLRGTIIIVLVVFFLARVLDLTLLDWLLRNGWPALLVAIPVIFQSEIRRALERVGRAGHWAALGNADYEALIDIVVEACERLSQDRHGALIVLERDTGLEDYIDTGRRVDAMLSTELVESIFYPNSPLHDGALVVRGNRVAAAGCTLPLSGSGNNTGGHLGTRHRAAVGITEVTDALAIVVSEETGQISVASSGRMISRLDASRLRALLFSLYVASGRLERRALRRRRVQV